MNCRPGSHDWEEVTVEQEGKETRLRRCRRPRCERWDEMRGVWTVLGAVSARDDLVVVA